MACADILFDSVHLPVTIFRTMLFPFNHLPVTVFRTMLFPFNHLPVTIFRTMLFPFNHLPVTIFRTMLFPFNLSSNSGDCIWNICTGSWCLWAAMGKVSINRVVLHCPWLCTDVCTISTNFLFVWFGFVVVGSCCYIFKLFFHGSRELFSCFGFLQWSKGLFSCQWNDRILRW